jgi:hypothetical protein
MMLEDALEDASDFIRLQRPDDTGSHARNSVREAKIIGSYDGLSALLRAGSEGQLYP